MSRRRQEKVTELIHRAISNHLLQLGDPGIGLVTVLGVRLTADFSSARVFYSVLGSHEERERAQGVLEKAVPFLRGQLGKLESLKFAPAIDFAYDSSVEEAQKVLGVLSDLEKEREEQKRKAA